MHGNKLKLNVRIKTLYNNFKKWQIKINKMNMFKLQLNI